MAKQPQRRPRPLKDVELPVLTEVAFDYIKSAQFRVIRADGAIGSVTPSGHIHFALYSERQAIPRRLVHELAADGSIGDIRHDMTESRSSIVREMDVDVFMTADAAKSLRDWLTMRLEELSARAQSSN